MFILDTNVVYELRKVCSGRGNDRMAIRAQSVDTEDLYLSVITVQELDFRVQLASHLDPAQGAMLRQWFDQQVLLAFEGRILPVDTKVAPACKYSTGGLCGTA